MSDKRCVGYTRVSTGKQAAEGVSLDAQRARIEAWAAQNERTDVDWYSDEGISGKSLKRRPGAREAIARACESQCPLVVYSLSRLCRSTREAIDIADTLRQAGADLVSLTENLDTTTPTGRLIYTIIAAFGQFEREIISERTKACLAHVRAQGKRAGAVPYGYDCDGDGNLTENPEQQQAIKIMKTGRKCGVSYARIARDLHVHGYPTGNGGRWQAQTVRRILKAQG